MSDKTMSKWALGLSFVSICVGPFWVHFLPVLLPPNRPPTAIIEASIREGQAPLTVAFLSRSNDLDGEELEEKWFINNIEVPSVSIGGFIHTFAVGGTNIVRLRVRDSGGKSANDAVTVNVSRTSDRKYGNRQALLGRYQVLSFVGKCLEPKDGNGMTGVVVGHECKELDQQLWGVTVSGEIHSSDGRCLSPVKARKGEVIVLGKCSGQQWEFTHAQQIKFGELCLDVRRATADTGTPVILWTCHGGTNQQWWIRPG